LGKTTLFKALAGSWPHAVGQVGLPDGSTLFLPQQSYLATSALVDAVAYPRDPAEFPIEARREALRAVGLGQRLESGADEGRVLGLSGGELQRLALARLLLLRPEWAFLDEATSALDPAAEAGLLALLRRELPGTAFVVVAHRKPLGLGALRIVALGAASTSQPHLVPA
jgi:putative ATP-binding cassette transporter